ncbi:FadR/GntR family transcriptional regulator [Bifidobacterium subtile]|uniref:GntR family transcriptional regulator n=1 Tax=Bifidobacterium subtile TaxID=77635 RepID=A0A087EAH0_9BIFI|nr:FadR/GntR family transcriptional regulator [Bifidobacterium subtile]KFJ04771.1 GntR family transcriptional regulator [Bifidobacterium subtile]QOL35846.1 FadR family transcriptional regulator [Bifidobacterium subtile]
MQASTTLPPENQFKVPDGSIPPLKFVSHSVSAQVADHIEQLIMVGTLRPGTRLPAERKLAEQFKVSRASIREALSELESKHLIERVQGRGSTVLDPMSNTRRLAALMKATDTDLRNAIELRESVEPQIAALAAQRAQPIHLAALSSTVDQEADESISSKHSMQLDIRFHLLLAHATGNTMMLTVLQFSFKCTEHVRERSHQTAAGRRISLIGHQLIEEAVKARDPEQAKHAMIRHLADVRDISTLVQ